MASEIDRERILELLALIVDERGKKQRREYVAALRELLRPVLEDHNGSH